MRGSSPEELRLLCQELDWLGGFLKNCSYHWASIAPDNFQGCLPVVELEHACRGIRFLNCRGRLEGNRVYLSEMEPFSFAGFVAET